jgi:sugar/nucleoside kinase (ribokinase family)
MATSARFLCLDTVMVDVVMKVATLPLRGGDTVALEHLVAPGGGFNAMSAASRHGMSSLYVGRLGTGPFSSIARDALERENIATPVASDLEGDIGFCLVVVDDQGERTFVTAPGVEGQLGALDLVPLDVVEGDYVFVSGYDFVYRELAAVVEPWLLSLPSGVVVAFDPGARVMDIEPAVLGNVLHRADWLLCNASEAGQLTSKSSVEDSATVLMEKTGRRGVVVHEGASGCVVATRDSGPQRIGGFAVDVVDTNGAGDIHDGVFLSEVALGADVLEAARRANAAAAMSIEKFGPATCPTRDDVTRWYQQFS